MMDLESHEKRLYRICGVNSAGFTSIFKDSFIKFDREVDNLRPQIDEFYIAEEETENAVVENEKTFVGSNTFLNFDFYDSDSEDALYYQLFCGNEPLFQSKEFFEKQHINLKILLDEYWDWEDEEGLSIKVVVTDNYEGPENSQTIGNIKIDATPPSITVTDLSDPTSDSTINNSGYILSISDSLSGISTGSTNITINGDIPGDLKNVGEVEYEFISEGTYCIENLNLRSGRK